MAPRGPTDPRKRSRTAGVNGAGATVARIVVRLGLLTGELPSTKVGKIDKKALRADIAWRLAD